MEAAVGRGAGPELKMAVASLGPVVFGRVEWLTLTKPACTSDMLRSLGTSGTPVGSACCFNGAAAAAVCTGRDGLG